MQDPQPTAVLSLVEHLQREHLKIRKLLAECGKTSLDAALAAATAAANRPLQVPTLAVTRDCYTLLLNILRVDMHSSQK